MKKNRQGVSGGKYVMDKKEILEWMTTRLWTDGKYTSFHGITEWA